MPFDRTGVVLDREALLGPRVAHREGSWSEREHRLLWSTRRRPLLWRAGIFSTLLFVFVVLNVMDAATTLFATMRLGWSAEGNAFLRWVGMRFGAAGFMLYKAGVVTTVVTALWFVHRGLARAAVAARADASRRVFRGWGAVVEAAAVVLVAVFLVVVAHNLALIVDKW